MIPAKPFESYKWRWLSVAPTESLLSPPVFLGVLRALAKFENHAPSEVAVADALRQVQLDTHTPVDLVRTPERNLIRNSGQYWKGTGLLAPTQGTISLTELGRRVASGQVTQGEFAALMVQQTVLPNPATYNPEEIAKWRSAGLEIRPLKLILAVVEELGRSCGQVDAYITNDELIKVVVPLAGVRAPVRVVVEHVVLYRTHRLDITAWPDCAPMANDKRLAHEFLLFLANFGILRMGSGLSRDLQKFHLDEIFDVEAVTNPAPESIFISDASAARAVEEVRHSALPSIIERQRTVTSVLARTGQGRFRTRIMAAYGSRCFVTGETIPEVLEAAHIVPVTNGGADTEDNGLCLRVDIHRLFDSGNIRLRATGAISLSEAVAASGNYGSLPSNIPLPAFVNPANVEWRDNYL